MFSQEYITYDSLKCIDIKFDIINYKLSVYNVAYYFKAKNGDTIIINKKCNYETTGIYYFRSSRLISTLIGFTIDSVYFVTLRKFEVECDRDKLWYYCFLKFNSNEGTFNLNTFNVKEATRKGVYFNIGDNKVDMKNEIFLMYDAFPRHAPPDYLLPEKIYPLYLKNKKGEYKRNKRDQSISGQFNRVTIRDDGSIINEPIVGRVP